MAIRLEAIATTKRKQYRKKGAPLTSIEQLLELITAASGEPCLRVSEPSSA